MPTLASSLPPELQRNYGVLRELDIRFNALQQQMERQCSLAVWDVVSSDTVSLENSDRIDVVQKECLTIARDKLAVAVQAYEFVDSQIQQLETLYREYEEDRKRERDGAVDGAAVHLESKSGGGGPSLFVDPNEPTYCYCNQVSYGEMIACYNPKCKLEWFHFGCVGIKERPRGKWSCSQCSRCKRQRGN